MIKSPKSDKISFLKQHPFFADLTDQQVERLTDLCTTRVYSRGEIIDIEGDPCRIIYFVVSGSVRAIKMSTQGREQVINTLWPGQAFYIAPAVENGPLPTTTEAASRTQLILFQQAEWMSILNLHPTIALHILVSFAKRLGQLTSLVGDLSLRSVSERLSRLLLTSARTGRGRMTQRETAAHVGTVREVVARTLATFEHKGWIEMQRGRIEIINPDALENLAEM